MSRFILVDADDLPSVLAALQATGIFKGEVSGAVAALQAEGFGPPSPGDGRVIVARVMHEAWCPMPRGGGGCVCRDDHRNPAAERVAVARRRAKNKAARKASRKGKR